MVLICIASLKINVVSTNHNVKHERYQHHLISHNDQNLKNHLYKEKRFLQEESEKKADNLCYFWRRPLIVVSQTWGLVLLQSKSNGKQFLISLTTNASTFFVNISTLFLLFLFNWKSTIFVKILLEDFSCEKWILITSFYTPMNLKSKSYKLGVPQNQLRK